MKPVHYLIILCVIISAITGITICALLVHLTPPESQYLYNVDYPEEITEISTNANHPDTFTMYRKPYTNRLILSYANNKIVIKDHTDNTTETNCKCDAELWDHVKPQP